MDRATVRGVPVACDLSVFGPGERQRHARGSEFLAGACREFQDLPDGYAFRFPDDAATWVELAEWVALERRCCPFLTFTLTCEAEGGAVWLRVTGREGTRDFLQTALGLGKWKEFSEGYPPR